MLEGETHLSQLSTLITKEEIENRVAELAAEIREDYLGKNPLLLGILKGSFVFMSDLIRKLNIPLEIEFIRLSSYGAGKEPSNRIRLVHGINVPLKDRHVLIIEDIVDTGLTVRYLHDYLNRKRPSSIKLCTLFDKPSRRVVDVTVDYLGFKVPDTFVVGYGIDFDEKFRYLPDLCIMEGQV
ncbi:MAG: hypoxanthine phosphoribosyltransferase [Dehalococcoidia bacterium]|nr:MAG: hypoxanthine phosphoribosyltransferase [Dehalococcoidia bacterium]